MNLKNLKPVQWLLKKLKQLKDWLFMKKRDVRSDEDFFTFQTKKILVVTAGFLIFSFLLAVTLVALWREGEPVVAVPDVLGQHVTDAVIAVQQRNLVADLKVVSNPEKPPGVIVDQNPKGGFYTKEKRPILLLVNQHIHEGELPGLAGKTLNEAALIITALNNTNFAPFIQNVAYTYSESVEPGIIISQQPGPGLKMDSSIPVNLLISKGAEGMYVELPDFSAMSIDQAVSWIAMNDLTPKILRSSGGAEGTISGQHPQPSTKVSHGSVISLEASTRDKYGVFDFVFPRALRLSEANLQESVVITTEENEDAAEEAAPDTGITAAQRSAEQASLMRQGSASYAVQIYKVSGSSRESLYNGEHKPGEHLILPFSYSDTVSLEMFIGGQRFISRKYM